MTKRIAAGTACIALALGAAAQIDIGLDEGESTGGAEAAVATLGDVAVSAGANVGLDLIVETERLRERLGPRDPYLPPPPGARLFMARDFRLPSGSGWRFRADKECVSARAGGPAVLDFTPSSNGVHYVWVYFEDWKKEPGQKRTGELSFAFMQGGRTLGAFSLHRAKSPLSTDRGVTAYGVRERPWPSFVWQGGAFRTDRPGPVEILMAASGGAYDVKALVVTDDPSYEPRLPDFFPMYLKVVSKDRRPLVCHLYMRNPIGQSLSYKMPAPLAPGGDSGWFFCSRFLPYGKRTLRITLADENAATNAVDFMVMVSRFPDDSKAYFSTSNNGVGRAVFLTFEPIIGAPDDAKVPVASALDGSLRSLRLARALDGQRGRAPRRFNFALPVRIPRENVPVWENECAAAEALGCNLATPRSYDSPLGYYQNSYDSCLCSPRRSDISKNAERIFRGTTEPGIAWFMDEPGGWPTASCANCLPQFHRFLRENGVSPADLGVSSYKDLAPVSSPDPAAQEKEMAVGDESRRFAAERAPAAEADDVLAGGDEGLSSFAEDFGKSLAKTPRAPGKAPERFYWSMRYKTSVLRRFYAFATDEVRRWNPEARTTATLSPDFVDKANALSHGIDYFDFFDHGALTVAQTEDWCNVSGDYRVCGYLVDFMRGAAARSGIPVSVYDVMCGRDPWEITAKAFCEIAHGATALRFFGYGPSYLEAEYSSSDNPEIYGAMKSVTFPVGACEDIILDGVRAKGDVAQLYSLSTEIQMSAPNGGAPPNPNPGVAGARIARGSNATCGFERMWANTLLSHAGYSADIVDEGSIAGGLDGYSVLYAGEFNIRCDAVAPLMKWIDAGGTLVLSAGALERDEFNRPLGFDEAIGLARPSYYYHFAKAPEEISGVVVAKGSQTLSGGAVLRKFDSGRTAAVAIRHGKGQVIALAFSPGMTYWWSGETAAKARNRAKTCVSDTVYPAVVRDFLGSILREAGASRVASADDYRVEARLVRGADADVVIVSNWAIEPLREVRVSLPGAKYRSVECHNAESAAFANGILTLRGLPAGDCIRCVK